MTPLRPTPPIHTTLPFATTFVDVPKVQKKQDKSITSASGRVSAYGIEPWPHLRKIYIFFQNNDSLILDFRRSKFIERLRQLANALLEEKFRQILYLIHRLNLDTFHLTLAIWITHSSYAHQLLKYRKKIISKQL